MGVRRALGIGAGAAVVGLSLAVLCSLRPLPGDLSLVVGQGRPQVLDRARRPLSYSYAGEWNTDEQRALHDVPESLQRAFIEAEDARFFGHAGVDWAARLHAVWQNLRAGRIVRGASTITEQVVRMIHPRPRSLWARFIEGVEAWQLERRASKREILEFYLNQVPFAARRRGVAQAARYYWGRDLETLTVREQLALAVMVRAPERLDLYKGESPANMRVRQLAQRLSARGAMSDTERTEVQEEGSFSLSRPSIEIEADHFVRFVRSRTDDIDGGRQVRTTLDGSLQEKMRRILEDRVRDLSASNVTDGALLVVDNRTAQVLAWVNAGSFGQAPGSQFDAVVTPRQPGSTLKPFVYALAVSKGWTASTIVDDSPLSQGVGAGLHNFRNYSRIHYGPLPLRHALGNSLNVPAVKAIQHTGKGEFLAFLLEAGFRSLTKSADFYGEGLALGNGEVTLFELVQAYTALAHRGVWRPLKVHAHRDARDEQLVRQLVAPEVSSIIADILADPQARSREFGSGGLLRFPVETAVKTGTSTDYRDAWAVGFSDNFTVGVWLGNLNRSSMREISGARGPALVLRSAFAELERGRDTKPLFRSRTLSRRAVCSHTGELAGDDCPRSEELFVPGTEPQRSCAGLHAGFQPATSPAQQRVSISLPTPGLNAARDPRIPDELEAFPFELSSSDGLGEVTWMVDGSEVATRPGKSPRFLWPLEAGHHVVKARAVSAASGDVLESDEVGFWVR